ncbi:MAG: Gfo/Idh/MocA family oxidoreductase [Chloroflexota bacterium]
MNQKRLRVGVAGLGRSGWKMHVAALSKLPDLFTITAVCDLDPSRLEEAQARLGCRTCATYDELVAAGDIDLMVVATPSQHHANDTITALEAGMDVMVEKPMATTLADVDRMIVVARENGRLLTVNQNYRYAADFLQIKKVIDSGVLGDLLLIRLAQHQFRRRWDWQTLAEYGGGILNNHGAHYIDWALQLIGDSQPEVAVSQLVDTPLYAGDADSHAKVILRPKAGPLVDIELTHACAFPQETAVIMGTQGTLTSTREEIRWQYYRPDQVPPLVLDRQPTPDRSYNAEQLPMWQESVRPVLDFPGELQQLYRDLHATICHDAPLVITPESVRDLMAVLEACRSLA